MKMDILKPLSRPQPRRINLRHIILMIKSGAGLCTAAVCNENRTTAVSQHPEIMTLIYKTKKDLLPNLKNFNSIMAGPGLGVNQDTLDIITLLIQQTNVPLVLDADALTVLQGSLKKLNRNRKDPLIITPHPGEFSRLTGLSIPEILRDRFEISRTFAIKNNVYVILKGHHTIIATPEGNVYLNPTGNPGMASAGSGDVLSGILTGMICQFFNKFSLDPILQAAVFIHGYAGDLAAEVKGEISLTAGDILDFIPNTFMALQTNGHRTTFIFS